MIVQHHLIFGRTYRNLFFKVNDVSQPINYFGNVVPANNRNGIPTAINFIRGYFTTVNAIPASGILSFSFYIKTAQTTVSVINLMGSYLSDGHLMMLFNDASANKFQVNIRTSTGSFNNVKYANSVVINDDTWKHVVVVLNRNLDAGNEIKIWINKVQQSLTTQGQHNTDKITDFASLPINFGSNPPNLTGYYVGLMSDINIYTRELSVSEINNL